ncbi:pyridoxamine 5'-phosphate oxidase family protein [Heliobacterium gestii]|uniref:Pyridoxamine 5'-phosphate oxidase family protein n=1 Tax=Heliomicrobium gestii TaxID=2699 RepID=A0A845LA91_HELGE|nr:pyridoxamine 5'-phosphate oxidase family protein [Heliomicrobium gestii]MBM7865600.1 putative pyridoxamine 5'-phosphate oxidase family protein [Heliomicrobium gestii]MZP41850.1 pyridoxamine 5'-phosphate oxidase family protein [Heliomicrobium gestii]
MQEVIQFLNDNTTVFVATIEDGKPRVRPFQFMFEEGGKLYFCTNNTKDVYNQLKHTPFIEFSATSPSFAWVRVSGEVQFSDDVGIKEKILEKRPLVKSIYKTADNPIFEAFYIEHGKAILADFSGNPPKVVNF